MNKDVIYIEPEQDITDILSSVKAAKHKIVALVPPKKAGVLRSSVNFKLIAKAAAKNDKTVVLVTTDESLRRLAGSVSMPVAKNLQSKPQLPDDIADEPEEEAAPAKAADEPEEKAADKEPEVKEEKKPEAEESGAKKIPIAVAASTKKKDSTEEDVIEGEPEPEAKDGQPKTKSEKNVAKMKGAKIPNFAKYRKLIIAGAIALILLVGFSIWAGVIAPAAKITVKVTTSSKNFAEKVKLVTELDKEDAANGTLFLDSKTVTKTLSGEFEATGEEDRGTKATGKVTVTLPSGSKISKDQLNLSIPKGAIFTISDKQFIVDSGASVPVDNNYNCSFDGCRTTKDISSGEMSVTAKEIGDSYNIAAAAKGITSSVTISSAYVISSTAMTGGAHKFVKVVSQDDIDKAIGNLDDNSESEARDELNSMLSDKYITFGSMKKSDPTINVTPALGEEVAEGVTPKITKELTYTINIVPRDSAQKYIETVVNEQIKTAGDDTQTIYDSGVSRAFFETSQNSNEEGAAKLKTVVKVGPRVTEEMVREKALGVKVGEVRTRLKSYNGVQDVKVDTSYFWVTSVPSDINKVEIIIENVE